MLSAIRKFSSSIYAKIFLFIVAIPFVFWGMGPLFTGGNLNVIAKIGKNKISTQEFANFLKYRATDEEMLNINSIEKLLSNFIGDKLIDEEIEDFDIKLSDYSLSAIIKNEEIFKKGNKFSRTKYEKFLVENSLDVITLETNISKQKKKEQLFDFIVGGIVPPNFMVNIAYNKANQTRYIQAINLNDIIKQKLSFSKNQIESYFNQNKDVYKDIRRFIKFVKLNPKNLTGSDEFNDSFFQKIDEIDDLIVEGKNLDFILNKFNLGSASLVAFNKSDMEKNSKNVNDFPFKLIKSVFSINEMEPITLIELTDEYFIIQIEKTENIQRDITDELVKKNILLNLEKQTRRKFISEIIGKINKNNFKKNDFDKLSNDENVAIKKIKLKNQNDDEILKQELINQVYAYPEKMIIVVADISLRENFLIYIDKIESVSIDKNPDNYKKYFDSSQARMINNLYNTYDSYLKNKYEININYKALDSISR